MTIHQPHSQDSSEAELLQAYMGEKPEFIHDEALSISEAIFGEEKIRVVEDKQKRPDEEARFYVSKNTSLGLQSAIVILTKNADGNAEYRLENRRPDTKDWSKEFHKGTYSADCGISGMHGIGACCKKMCEEINKNKKEREEKIEKADDIPVNKLLEEFVGLYDGEDEPAKFSYGDFEFIIESPEEGEAYRAAFSKPRWDEDENGEMYKESENEMGTISIRQTGDGMFTPNFEEMTSENKNAKKLQKAFRTVCAMKNEVARRQIAGMQQTIGQIGIGQSGKVADLLTENKGES